MLVCQPNELRSNIRVAGGIIRSGRLTDLSLPENAGLLPDASGNGNDATALAGRHITTNGVSDYVSFPSLPVYNIAGVTRKITFWVKVSAWSGSGSQYIIGRQGVSSGGWIVVHESSASSLGFLSKQSGSASNYSLVRFPRPADGVWNYVELTVTNAVLTAASVNGVSQTLTTAVAPTGSYGDTAVALTIGQSVSSGYFAGSIADVQLLDGTTEVLHARLNEHADLLAAGLNGLPAFDSSSNANHGGYVGCVGENTAGDIPQSSSIGWNKRMWFDGVDDWVTIPTQSPGTGDFDYTFNIFSDFRTGALFGGMHLLASSAGGTGRIYYAFTPGTPDVNHGFFFFDHIGVTEIAVPSLSTNVLHTIRTVRVSGVVTIYFDGVQVATAAMTRDLQGMNALGRQWGGVTNVPYANGLLWTSLGGVVYGSDPSNGTLNGSPTNVLIPSNDNVEDILGNALSVPRPTTSTFNGFGEGETFTVAPGSGKSLFLWVYWDGATAVTYLTNGSWALAVSALGALTATSGTLYVDGAAGSTLTTGWNCVGLSHGSDITFGTLTGAGRQDRLTVYAQQLSASQQAQNYRATKGNYP